jgi:hypothetical protein
VINEDDLVAIANRIWRPLDLLLEFLADALRAEHDKCIAVGLDPVEDPCTFAGTIRRNVYDKIKPHLPPQPGRAPMSPLYLDLGPYQLRVLHAENGTVPRPRTAARRQYYRRNELGILSMNILDHPLIEIEEDISEVKDGSLVLVWDNDGAELTQAHLYRPPLSDFPGRHLDLLTNTVVEVEADFDVRLDDTGTDIGRVATGTYDTTAPDAGTDAGGDTTVADEMPPHSPCETDSS